VAGHDRSHPHSDRHLYRGLVFFPRYCRIFANRIPAYEGIAVMRSVRQQANTVAMAAFSCAIIGVGAYVALLWVLS
jgi:hypothetical protein